MESVLRMSCSGQSLRQRRRHRGMAAGAMGSALRMACYPQPLRQRRHLRRAAGARVRGRWELALRSAAWRQALRQRLRLGRHSLARRIMLVGWALRQFCWRQCLRQRQHHQADNPAQCAAATLAFRNSCCHHCLHERPRWRRPWEMQWNGRASASPFRIFCSSQLTAKRRPCSGEGGRNGEECYDWRRGWSCGTGR